MVCMFIPLPPLAVKYFFAKMRVSKTFLPRDLLWLVQALILLLLSQKWPFLCLILSNKTDILHLSITSEIGPISIRSPVEDLAKPKVTLWSGPPSAAVFVAGGGGDVLILATESLLSY